MAPYRRELDARRIEQGLTVEALAQRAGLAVGAVSNTINGRTTPYRRTAWRLADALRCTPAEIGLGTTEEGGAA